jgi:cytidine deaminase
MSADPEDAKLRTLARASRARIRAAQGAAVRDLDGRTYTAASIDLSSLKLSAVAVAVAMAVSSGARGLEAAVLCSDTDSADPADLDVIRDLGGSGVALQLIDAAGGPVASTHT